MKIRNFKRQRNRYHDNGDGTSTLTITRRDGSQHDVILDASDVEAAKLRCWRYTLSHVRNAAGEQPYAYVSTGNGRAYTLGAYLLGVKTDRHLCVHYRNGNTLDCRRSNLMEGDRSAISYQTGTRPESNTRHHHIHLSYKVELSNRGVRLNGTFTTLDEAIKWRDAKARELWPDQLPKSWRDRA